MCVLFLSSLLATREQVPVSLESAQMIDTYYLCSVVFRKAGDNDSARLYLQRCVDLTEYFVTHHAPGSYKLVHFPYFPWAHAECAVLHAQPETVVDGPLLTRGYQLLERGIAFASKYFPNDPDLNNRVGLLENNYRNDLDDIADRVAGVAPATAPAANTAAAAAVPAK